MRKVLARTTAKISAIGQGLSIGPQKGGLENYDCQVENVRLGIEHGMTLLDTSPVYGDGRSELLVREVLTGGQVGIFVATKLRPGKTRSAEVRASALESLQRLQVSTIDLLQVHWPHPKVPIAETMEAMERLVEDGLVRHLGVSNFTLAELQQARGALGSADISSVQVEYNLFDRGIEADLLPYCQACGVSVLAYSPLHRGRIANGPAQVDVLRSIGADHDATAAQVALSWLISHEPVVAIPNSTNAGRLVENARAVDIKLSADEIDRISIACKPNTRDIDTDRIKPSAGTDGAKDYRTVAEARDNLLGLSPSPAELSEQILQGDMLKPVRVVPSPSENSYVLAEGRLRFWAWMIAYGGQRPIPALIDESGQEAVSREATKGGSAGR